MASKDNRSPSQDSWTPDPDSLFVSERHRTPSPVAQYADLIETPSPEPALPWEIMNRPVERATAPRRAREGERNNVVTADRLPASPAQEQPSAAGDHANRAPESSINDAYTPESSESAVKKRQTLSHASKQSASSSVKRKAEEPATEHQEQPAGKGKKAAKKSRKAYQQEVEAEGPEEADTEVQDEAIVEQPRPPRSGSESDSAGSHITVEAARGKRAYSTDEE